MGKRPAKSTKKSWQKLEQEGLEVKEERRGVERRWVERRGVVRRGKR